MFANFESRSSDGSERVCVYRYRNLHNLPHWHLESELIYAEQGETDVSDNHQSYTLRAGEAVFLDGGEIHYVKSRPDAIVDVLQFDSALSQDFTRTRRLCSAKLSRSYSFLSLFGRIRQELTERPPFYERKCCELIVSLLIDVFRGEETARRTRSEEQGVLSNYKNLLEEIEEKYSYFTFDDAAKFMGLSGSYFSRLFHRLSGMTFSQYLNVVKLEHAIRLLQQPGPRPSSTAVAAQCGFDTIRHFNRVFRDMTGMSPRELPADYVLNARPVRTERGEFNPTLQSSEPL